MSNVSRVMRLKYFFAGAVASTLSACVTVATDIPRISQSDIVSATPAVQKTTIDAKLSRIDRVEAIAWPILVANADLCHDRRRDSFGIRLGNDKTIRSLVDGLTLKQVRALGYNGEPVVLGVQPGSPADLAGLEPGAVPIKIGDTQIDGDFDQLSQALAEYNKARAKAKQADTPKAELEKLAVMFRQPSGDQLEAKLEPITVCNIPVSVGESDAVNASAGGRAINIRRGLLTYFEDDADVGFIVAHEIGHVIGRHVRKQQRNSTVTGYSFWGVPVALGAGLFDGFFAGPLERFGGLERPPGRQMMTRLNNRILGTREFEREADYLGMYIAARSGLDISGAEDVFAGFAKLSARSTYGENSHPVTADRMLALAAAREEIETKVLAKETLVPNGWPYPLPGVDVEE